MRIEENHINVSLFRNTDTRNLLYHEPNTMEKKYLIRYTYIF